jgi:alpha-beta hydrolase superfamily lysophospholipase
MLHVEFEMISTDGLKLHSQGWEPDAEVKAVVCLVHGLGEHSGRYDHMAEAFNRDQYALLAFDLRGHGRSEGRRGHAPSYTLLMSDIEKLLNEAAVRYPDVPCFLYGHSLGGNLAIYYSLTEQPKLAGVIASAPLLRLAYKPSQWKTGILRGLQAMRMNFSMPSGLDDNALSRDQNVVRTYRNDPLTHDLISARLAMDMLRYGQWNLKHAAEFTLPLLLMHGEADRITSAAASVEFAKKVDRSCTLKIWAGFNHELHNEPEKRKVFDYVLEWMEQMTRDTATG